MAKSPITIIDLERIEVWPSALLEYLDKHYTLFLDWESGRTNGIASAYDRAIGALDNLLQQYAITGWHCTRLTKTEIASIISNGMQLPDAAMLGRRITDLLNAGCITESIAGRLKAKNQAHEENRAGRVWFCFFPPRIAGEIGIASFFRFWGGEALYNSHDCDPETGIAIRSIGVPCLVEADVPIASLGPRSWLSVKIVRRFLVNRGYQTHEPVDHEDRTMCSLPAENIRRIICFPETEFVTLTGCDSWDEPLKM